MLDSVTKSQPFPKVIYLAAILGVVIAATFFVSLSAAVNARSTETASNALVAAGAATADGKILETTDANERVPVALSPLLTPDQMGRVQYITVSNLGYFTNTGDFKVCEGCPINIIVKVDIAMKYEGDVLVKFKRSGGMVVTVDKGIIEVENVPGQDPYQRFVTCGKASCASVKIEGVDVAALTMRAKTLGYGNVSAGRRADGQHSGHHRRTLQDWIKAGDAFRSHAARRGDCTCRRGLKYGKKKRRSSKSKSTHSCTMQWVTLQPDTYEWGKHF